jgi:hypothetical protein
MRWFALVLIACSACFSSVCSPNDTACLDRQRAGAGGGGAAGQQCETLVGSNERVCVDVQPVVCNGVSCAAGSQCCFTTGHCFDPVASPGDCPHPDGGGACASNSQCAADEACSADFNGSTYYCSSVGRCQPRNNCPTCSPVGSPRCRACGCDGNTYESVQAACVAGIRVAAQGPCGTGVDTGTPLVVGCGTEAECTNGTSCCFITGHCYATSEPWRCELQADGLVLDCAGSAECNSGTGGHGGSDRFCAGTGCDTPGRCRSRSSNDCGGVLSPVCGCDGKTYTNECWAGNGGVRVASNGACDGG